MSHHLADSTSDMNGRYPTFLPAYLRDDGLGVKGDGIQRRPNLSGAAQHYLERIGADVEDLFHHVLAVLHDPAYREANAGSLRMEWPRIPVPGWPDGDEVGAADELAESAARGRKLAALLDSDTDVAGVTSGSLRPEIAVIAVPSTTDGGNMDQRRLRGHRRLGSLRLRPGGDAGPGPCRRASIHPRGARGDRRRHLHARRHDVRHLPQRPRLLEQRPVQRLGLQARRLPGPQEVAVLPRAARCSAGRSSPTRSATS